MEISWEIANSLRWLQTSGINDTTGLPTSPFFNCAASQPSVPEMREFPVYRRVANAFVSDTSAIFYSHGDLAPGFEVVGNQFHIHCQWS